MYVEVDQVYMFGGFKFPIALSMQLLTCIIFSDIILQDNANNKISTKINNT